VGQRCVEDLSQGEGRGARLVTDKGGRAGWACGGGVRCREGSHAEGCRCGAAQELVDRLVYEVEAGAAAGGEAPAPAAVAAPAEPAAAAPPPPAEGCPAQLAAAAAATAAAAAAPGGAAAPPPPPKFPNARGVLCKLLLRTLAVACFAPHSVAAARPGEALLQRLYAVLGLLLRDNGRVFGGSLFALAASLVSDCLHADPLQYRALDEAGLPDAYLAAVQVGERAAATCTAK
jgi:hypothetical protein